MAPVFQEHIYPDSVIMLRGDDDFIRDRASELGEANVKWDPENLERRLNTYRENNDIDLFSVAKDRTDLGHPKTIQPRFPLLRFFQENKTEVFELDCDGYHFEMFESMRIYIEREGRSYNYLHSVKVLNVRREQALRKEEADSKSAKTNELKKQKEVAESEKAALEKLQMARLVHVKNHIQELEMTGKLNMRQFLMKQIIPVLTEGMIDVYRVGPTDPVDSLADYIFKKSNELRKGQNKMARGKQE